MKLLSQLKLIALVLSAVGVICGGLWTNRSRASSPDNDYVGTDACKDWEKKYDPAKPDDEQVQAVLKGKKAEKPPNMPGYESKGVTAEQAKALVDYMKSLRQ